MPTDDLDDPILNVIADPVDPVDPTPDEPVLVVTPAPAPAKDPLAGAAWENVVSLMETQNALLQKNLSGLAPALDELKTAAGAVKAATDKVNAALEKLAAKEDPATGPEDIPPTEQTPPAEPAPRKAGPRWRK